MTAIATVRELIAQGLNPGKAQTSGPLTLVPLFGGAPAKDYLVAAEAFAAGLVSITEIGEGSVPQLAALNRSDLPVLLLDGEHLVGAKQNRVLNTTVLLAAGKKTLLPVSCVEEGRWHYEDVTEAFSISDDSAYTRLRAVNARSHAENVRAGYGHSVDQGMVWADVASRHDEVGVAVSPTGAMGDAYDLRREEMEKILESFSELEPGQTGVLAFVGGKASALDAFDRPETLSKLWHRLLSGYAMDAIERPTGKYDDASVDSFLASAAGAPYTEHAGVGLGTNVVITSDQVVGGALAYETGVVHVSLFAHEPDSSGTAPTEAWIATPRHRRGLHQ